ncbi:putative phosphoenolpyruvate synthase-like protein [Dinothrombium tinctorium]|uniref:Putative phosphoenolpyruvate synthase-like protein n=1 Tax=Dinothrombium tinctorium TaxID=1965070 RepID=A0A443QBX2_9ACAR|nr:putative phosphoenolpyruvate synthase-like protein [Dinothrombium tinctorium]
MNVAPKAKLNCEEVKGSPVYIGKAEGRAIVAHSIEEACYIKPGDILITFGTDVGWSPYFPMLSGIATEVGGLISHGAVIAREYGLPCIIGATNATQIFKTGDRIVLDSEKGIIYKVVSD